MNVHYRIGIEARKFYRDKEASEMHLTNSILKKELREKFQETTELKNLLALMDKDLTCLKEKDTEETIAKVRDYKAKRFN